MEKDQNINSESQNEEIKETEAEEQGDLVEEKEEVKEITPEEEIKETEAEEQGDLAEEKEEVKEITPEEKIKELEDKVTRTFAEMENQRRRFEREKDDAFNYGGFSFAKEALNLIDNLERSKQILESDEVLRDTEALKKTLEHFEIISKDMVSIFSKNEITPIISIGKKLDPNQHQAMMEIDDDQKEPGTIVQEIQKGFMMKDRLLRPALVGVSKKTKIQNNHKNEENEENLDN
jgi:molecular chaperone GrpE